jgi:hypothetical protein
MRPADPNLFSEFEAAIWALPLRERFDRAELLIPAFRLHQDGPLEMYYAPFSSVNPSAAIVLLGITPGWTQMEIAYRVARREMDAGATAEEICRIAKQNASFAGTMRTNLVRMLDDLDVPSSLGIGSTSELFGSAAPLVHTASAIRYPVFVNGRNYTGHGPDMLRNLFLRDCLESILAPELASVPDALVVPLGNAVSAALQHLASLGALSVDRCLFGFPHPSGANGRRAKDFTERREEMRKKVATHFHRKQVAEQKHPHDRGLGADLQGGSGHVDGRGV